MKSETTTLTRKQKWRVYLFNPLMMSFTAYVTLFLLEGEFPDGSSIVGLSLGFFVGHFIMGRFYPKQATYKGTKNPTKKQKIGRVILYTFLIGFYLFVVTRFLVRL
ncbi:hypothetical protein [Bacillus sp. JCM 19041]|uniref:hypothetical protein n=1 Tax=Bacillus sp. JCM 19041 TaxID=1460637 RepID=UPI0012E10A21